MAPSARHALVARTASWVVITAFSLALGEILLRWLCAMPSVARRLQVGGQTARRIGIVSCYREIRDHHTHDCVPREGPVHATFADAAKLVDPVLGWTNRPGEIPVAGTMAHISEQGLRSPRTFPLDKPPGVTRVAIFGDSFAFGSEVAGDDTYAAVLGRELDGAEVMNFGVPGYGPDQMLLRFRAEGLAFHPDVVVVGLNSLVLDRVGPFTTWYKPFFALQGDDLVLHGVPVPSLDQAADWQSGLRLFDLVRMVRESYSHERPDEATGRAILEQFVREIRAARAKPLLVLYPWPSEYERGSAASTVFHAVCAGTGVQCVDTSAAFASAARRGVALTSGAHWNASGHRIVADALLTALAAVPAASAP